MLNSPGHKGNANHNHTKILLTPSRMATIKNTHTHKKNKCCKIVVKKDLHTLLEGM
jgi:hypothetical protein